MNGKDRPAAAPAGEADTVEVPESVRVRCPLVEFRLRSMGEHCPNCPHFRGLTDRFPGSKHRFAVRYMLLCAAEPVKREIFEMDAA